MPSTERTFRVLDTRGEYLTEVVADCIENADYTAQGMGYVVLDYADDRTLIAESDLPAALR